MMMVSAVPLIAGAGYIIVILHTKLSRTRSVGSVGSVGSAGIRV